MKKLGRTLTVTQRAGGSPLTIIGQEERIMSNMSYCRFQNTVGDMEDCYEALHEAGSAKEYMDESTASMRSGH